MQQTLAGCAFCDTPPGAEMGKAHTWGKDERVTHLICVDCALQEQPNPEECDHHACDSCELVVDALAAITRFHVELGHLKGPVQLCARCSPDGPATYWTRDFESHAVE